MISKDRHADLQMAAQSGAERAAETVLLIAAGRLTAAAHDQRVYPAAQAA